MTPGWCRDCFTPARADDAACRACGGRRLVRHAEIDRLALAHVDCDAFYASIEKRDAPQLRDQPLIVGGGRRGVVSAACYIARAFGVRSAMPMFKALKACPDAVVIKPDMSKYVAEAARLRAMMGALTPLMEPLSIDEAFLDLSGTERLHDAAPALTLMRLQSRIETEIGVTVSVGLSFAKFLAKIASDLDKPRGFAVIGRAEAVAFLSVKPVGILPGVGPAFAKSLAKHGVVRIGDLHRFSQSELARNFGEQGLRLHRFARAEDARGVKARPERKSISAETTFETDLSDPDALRKKLWRTCVRVSDRAKAAGLAGRTVTLKLKLADFRSLTRRRTLDGATQLADRLYREADALLAGELAGRAYRLIGVGLSELTSETGDAGDLLDPQAVKRAAAERAADAARAKFGADAVMKGRALPDA